jgi:Flp pilus assembly protein TadB
VTRDGALVLTLLIVVAVTIAAVGIVSGPTLAVSVTVVIVAVALVVGWVLDRRIRRR